MNRGTTAVRGQYQTPTRGGSAEYDYIRSAARFNPITFNDPLHLSWASDPAYLPPAVAYTDVIEGLVLPGLAGNYAYLPDAPAYDITGDITLVARVALNDWQSTSSQSLVSKWVSTGSQLAWSLRMNQGAIRFLVSRDGATSWDSSSSVDVPFTNGETGWVAVTLDVDDGAGGKVVKFWTSTDGIAWSQLGVDRTNAGAISVFGGTAPVEFGTVAGGTTQPLAGNLSVARVYSGSAFSAAGPAGSLVLDVDFRRAKTQTFPAVGDYGIKNGQGLVLGGVTSDYATIGDSSSVSVTGDLDVRVLATHSSWAPAATQVFVAHQSSATSDLSWQVSMPSSNPGHLRFTWWPTGANPAESLISTAPIPVAAGDRAWIRCTRDATTGEVIFYQADGDLTNPSGADWVAIGDPLAGTAGALFDSTSLVGIGGAGTTGGSPFNGTISRAIVKDGIDGTPVVDANFAIQDSETQEFYDYCGNLVTVNVASQKVTVASAGAAIQQLQQGSVLTAGARLDPVEGLMLPGTNLANNFVSVPDSSILSPTGDICLVVRAKSRDWSLTSAAQILVAKWDSGSACSFRLMVTATGALELQNTTTGTPGLVTGTSTAALSTPNGEWTWIAATLDVDNGAGSRVYKFWTSADGVTWTQLGSTVTTAGTTSIFDSTTAVTIGGHTNTQGIFAGSISHARIYSGSTFTTAGPDASLPCVMDLDFRRAESQGFQGTSDYGIKADGLVLPGIAGAYATAPDNTVLDIVGDLTLVAKVTPTSWASGAAQTWISKWVSSTNQRSYQFGIGTTGFLRLITSNDGSAIPVDKTSSVAVPFANGETGWVAATLDVDNGAAGNDVTFWTSTDGVTWTQLGTTLNTAGVTSVFAGTATLDFGGINLGTSQMFTGTIHRAMVYNGAEFSAAGAGASSGLIVDADFESQDPETLVFDAAARKVIPGEGLDTQGAWRVNCPTIAVAPGQVNLTPDLEVVACLRMSDLTPTVTSYLLGHWGVSGTYHFTPFVGTGAGTGITFSPDGTSAVTMVTTNPISGFATPDEFFWIRWRIDVDDGAGNRVLTVHYSLDPVDTDPDDVTWTLFETVTTAGTTSIFTGSSTNLCVGALNAGAQGFPGTVAYVDFAGSFDGPRLFEMDFRDKNEVERIIRATSDYGVKQGTGLVLPPIQYATTGVAGPWADVPDSAALSITGDITLVAKATLSDWSTAGFYQSLISKRRDAAQRSYMLRMTPTGLIELVWSADGAALIQVVSTVAVPFANGDTGYVAATLDVDNGAAGNDVKFWTSTDGVTWTQLGTTVTSVGTTSIFDSTAPIDVGAALAGAAQNVNGTVHEVQVYSGSGFSAAGPSGAKVLDVDFTTPATDATSFVCDTGQVVTVLGAQPEMIIQGNWIPVAVKGCYPQVLVVSTDGDMVDETRGLISNGSGTGNVSLVSPVIDVRTGLDIRWKMDCPLPNRQDQHIVGQYTGTASTTRFLVFLSTAGNWQLFVCNGSATNSTTFFVDPEFATLHQWFRVTWRNVDGQAILWVSDDGVTWNSLSRAVVSSGGSMPAVTSTPVHVGGNQGGTGGWLVGDLHWLQIRDGIDGNVVFDADFRRGHTNAFVADTGQRVEVVSSLNPYNLTSSQQPNYEGALDVFNGAPAWHFDQTDDRHTILTGLYAPQPVWVVMVGSWDTLPASTRLAMGLDSNSATRGFGQRSSGATHLDMGGTVTGGAYTIDQSFIAVGYADGASGEVWLNGTLVASGATGVQAVNQMIIGCGRLAASTYQNFFDGYIYFDALYQTDPMAHPDWPVFEWWARMRGATVA